MAAPVAGFCYGGGMGSGFALIVVLFILLIIIGCSLLELKGEKPPKKRASLNTWHVYLIQLALHNPTLLMDKLPKWLQAIFEFYVRRGGFLFFFS